MPFNHEDPTHGSDSDTDLLDREDRSGSHGAVFQKERRISAGKAAAAVGVIAILAVAAYSGDKIYRGLQNRATRDTEEGIEKTLSAEHINDVSSIKVDGNYWVSPNINGAAQCTGLLEVMNTNTGTPYRPSETEGTLFLQSRITDTVTDGTVSRGPITHKILKQHVIVTHPVITANIMNGSQYNSFISAAENALGSTCHVPAPTTVTTLPHTAASS
jgi:hypothetical protein